MPFRLGLRQWIDFTGDFQWALARLRDRLRWLASQDGILQVKEIYLEDLQRDLQRANPDQRKRIRKQIDKLQQQIERHQPAAVVDLWGTEKPGLPPTDLQDCRLLTAAKHGQLLDDGGTLSVGDIVYLSVTGTRGASGRPACSQSYSDYSYRRERSARCAVGAAGLPRSG